MPVVANKKGQERYADIEVPVNISSNMVCAGVPGCRPWEANSDALLMQFDRKGCPVLDLFPRACATLDYIIVDMLIPFQPDSSTVFSNKAVSCSEVSCSEDDDPLVVLQSNVTAGGYRARKTGALPRLDECVPDRLVHFADAQFLFFVMARLDIGSRH